MNTYVSVGKDTRRMHTRWLEVLSPPQKMGAQVMKTYAIASIATTAVEVVVPNGTKKVPLAEWPMHLGLLRYDHVIGRHVQ